MATISVRILKNVNYWTFMQISPLLADDRVSLRVIGYVDAVKDYVYDGRAMQIWMVIDDGVHVGIDCAVVELIIHSDSNVLYQIY